MLRLLPHPSSAPRAVRSVDVALGRTANGYRFWYFLIGDIAQIVVPPASSRGRRADDLWRTTCFEAFLKGDGEAYWEFNFSPSGDWAAYMFDRYREGRRDMSSAVTVHPSKLDNLLCVEALMNANFDRNTRLCLSAVVEERDGTKSYWSLAHPDGPPDFHHDACFATRLADIA